MSDAKHTPGPWRVVPGSSGSLDVLACPPGDEEGTLIAETYICDREKANAQLIAAAPELLVLCKEAERLMPYIPADNFDGHAADFFRRLAEAIKKAEGGAA